MARTATIIGTALDHRGRCFDVRECRPARSPDGVDVLIGWPQDAQRGKGGGGVRAILTPELVAYLERHRHDPARMTDDLSLGRTAIKRLRARLGHHWREDRRLWWEERRDDLRALTLDEFAARHGCSTGAASQARAIIWGED